MDSLALELHGGYDFSAKYSKLKDAAAKTAPSGLDDQSSDVTDMDLLKYMAQLGVQWAPLYGKLNLTSELDIHVNWFINAGLGIAGVQRKLYQKSKAKTSEVVPAGNFGTGFRFFITKHWVARFEVKNYLFWNSVETVTKDLTNASAPSQRSTDTDFVNVLFLGFGAGYIF